MKIFWSVLCLLSSVLCGFAQQTTALVDASTYEFKRPTTAQVVSGNGLISAATVNGYFADPSTNGSFSASAWRSDLGLVIGTNVQAYSANLTSYAAIAPSANVVSLLGAADYSAMRTQLGLVIGTNVQAYSANLTSWAAITRASGFDTFTATPSGANLASLLTSALPASKGGTGLTALGTGVATALGVNTGSAGAFVVYNASLGTPTAGDISNAALTYRTATTSVRGGTLLATTAEALAGTDTAKTVVPSGLEARALLGDITRQIKDSLYSDGATSNRRVEHTPGTAGAVAALPISIPFEFQVPTSNPSAPGQILIGSSATAAAANGLDIQCLRSDGGFVLRQYGATLVDYRGLIYAGFRAAYSGQWIRGMVVFSSADSTTNPVIYVNGVDITSSFSANTAGTLPNWQPTTLDTTKLSWLNFPAGRFIPRGPILGALTAAEVLEWTQTGRLPTWCEVATGGAGKSPGAYSNFQYDTFSGASATGFTAAETGGQSCQATASSGGTFLGVLQAGAKVRLKFTATLNSGAVPTVKLALQSVGNASNIPTVVNGANEHIMTLTASSTAESGTGSLQVAFNTTGNTDYVISGMTYEVLGPIFKPVIQPIAVLADAGTNKIAGILTSGITPITEKRDWVIQGQTSTNGNQQLLGASVFFATNAHRIDSWVINNAGTSKTVSLGNVSAGTQYLSGGTAGAGLSDTTLATRFNATVNLWVNSNGTDVLTHTISGRKVD